MKLSSALSPIDAEKLKHAVTKWCPGECSKCPLKLSRNKYACSMVLSPNYEYPDDYYAAIIDSLTGSNIKLPFIRNVSVTEEDIISVFEESL